MFTRNFWILFAFVALGMGIYKIYGLSDETDMVIYYLRVVSAVLWTGMGIAILGSIIFKKRHPKG